MNPQKKLAALADELSAMDDPHSALELAIRSLRTIASEHGGEATCHPNEIVALRKIFPEATTSALVDGIFAIKKATTPPPAPAACDMGELCIGCEPRNPDGSCPDAPAAEQEKP